MEIYTFITVYFSFYLWLLMGFLVLNFLLLYSLLLLEISSRSIILYSGKQEKIIGKNFKFLFSFFKFQLYNITYDNYWGVH